MYQVVDGTDLSVLSIRAYTHRTQVSEAHIQGEKRKKGRTGIEPAAKAEPLPALSAVLHKVQVWGSPTSPSSRQVPTRQKTNSTVLRNLAKSSRQVPKAQDQLHSTPLG